MRGSAVLLAALLVPCSCGGTLPQPPRAPQPDEAFVDVPYPPPAAQVETIPPRPRGGLWIDGQWSWDGTRWTWMPGAWVSASHGARFAPWQVRLQRDGRLQYAPPSWRDAHGRELPPARVLSTALGAETNRTLPVRCP